MKHIKVGNMFIESETRYDVSLFDHNIFASFKTKKETMMFIKDQMIALFAVQELNTACIEVHTSETRSHYLIFDGLWSQEDTDENLEPVVFETSKYEFHKSHPEFFGPQKNRRVINERSFNYNDIVRSGANFHSWLSTLLVFSALILIVAGSLFGILSLEFSHDAKIGNQTSTFQMMVSIFTAVISIVISCLVLIIIILSHRQININKRNGERIDWNSWYLRRRHFAVVTTLFALAALASLVTQFIVLEWVKHFNNATDILYFATMITMIVIFTMFVIVAMSISLSTSIIMRRNLRSYYVDSELRKGFWHWLRDRHHANPPQKDTTAYLFDDSASTEFVDKEIEHAEDRARRSSKPELRYFSKKIRRNVNFGVKVYLDNLRVDMGLTEMVTISKKDKRKERKGNDAIIWENNK